MSQMTKEQEKQQTTVAYQVVYGGDRHELEKRVTAWVLEGWQLQGGVAVVYIDDAGPNFYQALTKES
jgi:hypothetical protein